MTLQEVLSERGYLVLAGPKGQLSEIGSIIDSFYTMAEQVSGPVIVTELTDYDDYDVQHRMLWGYSDTLGDGTDVFVRVKAE